MAFAPAEPDQAYAKLGFLGLQGSGKTFTATLTAIGLHKLLTERKVPGGGKTPIFMLDTETGSSWIAKAIQSAGIGFEVDKTRAMRDLLPSIEHVSNVNGILIIDSITAFWNEWKETYIEKKKLRRGLQFHHWDDLKSKWRQIYTDPYVNSPCHILMCGRQGYEYDSAESDDGKREIFKTAVRMKAESETGYEPSLLIHMDRVQELGSGGKVEKVYRDAFVLKDRSQLIDGQTFRNPTFESFLPHFESLNLGGAHTGVDTSRTSDDLVAKNESAQYDETQRAIVIDEIAELAKKHFPSRSDDDKQARTDALEKVFGTRSWKKIESLGLNELKHGHNELSKLLDKKPAYPELEALAEAPF